MSSEFSNFAIFLLNFVPDCVTTGRLEPCLGPGTKVIFLEHFLCRRIHMMNEIVKLSVLEGELFEVSLDTLREYSAAKLVESLVKPCSTLAI